MTVKRLKHETYARELLGQINGANVPSQRFAECVSDIPKYVVFVPALPDNEHRFLRLNLKRHKRNDLGRDGCRTELIRDESKASRSLHSINSINCYSSELQGEKLLLFFFSARQSSKFASRCQGFTLRRFECVTLQGGGGAEIAIWKRRELRAACLAFGLGRRLAELLI